MVRFAALRRSAPTDCWDLSVITHAEEHLGGSRKSQCTPEAAGWDVLRHITAVGLWFGVEDLPPVTPPPRKKQRYRWLCYLEGLAGKTTQFAVINANLNMNRCFGFWWSDL